MAVTVQYGDYTLPLVLGNPGYSFSIENAKLRFRCVFRVAGDPINTLVATAYTKCSLKHKQLIVTVDGNAIEDYSHADNEALLGVARISKVGERFDTEVARHFLFEWEAEAPANLITGGTDGKLTSRTTLVVGTTGDFATVHEGKFTAHSASDAKTKFEDPTTGAEAVAAAWHTANLSHGQTYRGMELVNQAPRVIYDDQLQTATYTLMYRERLVPDPDGAGGLTSAEAGNTDLTVENIDVVKIASGFHGFMENAGDRGLRPVTYRVNFLCRVRSNRAYSEFGTIYENSKASLLAYLTNSGAAAGNNPGNLTAPLLLEENAQLGLQSHTILVSWVLWAVGNGDYTRFNNRVRVRTDYRRAIRDLLDGTGNVVVHEPGEAVFAVQEIDAQRIGSRPELPYLTPLFTGGGSGWLLLEESDVDEESVTLTATGANVTAHDAGVSRIYRWINSSGAVFTEGPPP